MFLPAKTTWCNGEGEGESRDKTLFPQGYLWVDAREAGGGGMLVGYGLASVKSLKTS